MVDDMPTYEDQESLNAAVASILAIPIFGVGIVIGLCCCCIFFTTVRKLRPGRDSKAPQSSALEMSSFQQDLFAYNNQSDSNIVQDSGRKAPTAIFDDHKDDV